MRWQHLPLGGLVASSVAVNLYVSSYIGTITTLSLCQDANGNYSLTTIAANNGSAPSPSWLEKDGYNGIIYGLDEGLTGPNGSISSYKTPGSGVLKQIDRHVTLGGPVSSIVYNGGKALAVAHYGGSALSSWTIQKSGGLALLQNLQFTLSTPGTIPDRQDAPHPHEALVDPTDQFIVVPDLGADYIRVFSIDPSTSILTQRTPFSTPPGSGPRHGAFFVSPTTNKTYFFLVSELGNTVTSYSVSYSVSNNLGFTEVSSSGIYGNASTPVGAASGEGVLSPDARFFLTSCRNDSTLLIPPFDTSKNHSTALIRSDSLQSWAIDAQTGSLAFVQLAAAGGSFPRQFSVSRDGRLAAVGLQESGRVVIIERDVQAGTWGGFVAEVDVEGEVTSVVWDE
ncbi:putative 6-phosphogluconolactonase [Lachnellula hyalina]|uniref:Putative 6-phosphogluconolactonase n=1 Tax=Lachnellula hyalina TaxID=1316788 RepID=A0A8H8TZ40_9HELO|nr:putative 6-phosphogluconolactonase [Lachnellula hyalina]TVY25477.1 putative 6-phosphogluconolactonase [Lachnellula hyalina]